MKKSTLITIVALVLAMVLGIGGTIAFLTDTDSDVNVMVLGSIKIDQHEQDRNGDDFDQYQTMLPIVGGTSAKDENGYPANGNYIDKIVTVENTGKNDAYVRTFIAIPVYSYEGQDAESASANVVHWNGYSKGDETNYPAAGKVPGQAGTVANNWVWGKDTSAQSYWPSEFNDWNVFTTVFDGMAYEVYVITNTEAVKPGEITAPNLLGVYLDSKVDYDHDTGKYTYDGKEIANFDGTVKVLVATQAVQYDSGWKDAFDALNTAFGTPAADKHPWTGEKAASTSTSVVAVSSAAELTSALQNGGKIALIDNVTLANNEGISIPANSNTTLNLNGYTLSGSSDLGETTSFIANKGTLTIENGTIDYKSTGAAGGDSYGFYTIDNAGDLTINGAVIKNSTEDVWNEYGEMNKTVFAIDHKGGKLTINSGRFESNGRSVRIAAYSGKDADAVLNGGTFVGQVWLQGLNGKSTSLGVNGGEFSPLGGDGSSIFITNNLGTNAAVINDGLFNTKIGANGLTGFVKGGTFASQAAYDNTAAALFAADNTVTIK